MRHLNTRLGFKYSIIIIHFISGVIYNGAAITSKPIESSSTNHVANSNVNEVTTNQNVVVPSKPSPTKSLQVTMKDFDLLKVLGTGGKLSSTLII